MSDLQGKLILAPGLAPEKGPVCKAALTLEASPTGRPEGPGAHQDGFPLPVGGSEAGVGVETVSASVQRGFTLQLGREEGILASSATPGAKDSATPALENQVMPTGTAPRRTESHPPPLAQTPEAPSRQRQESEVCGTGLAHCFRELSHEAREMAARAGACAVPAGAWAPPPFLWVPRELPDVTPEHCWASIKTQAEPSQRIVLSSSLSTSAWLVWSGSGAASGSAQ